MAAPKLNVEVQPTQNGKAYYLPIAAKSDDDLEMVKIVLRLRITNNESKPITLKAITFSFPNTNISLPMQGVKIAMDPAGDADPDDGVIAPGTTAVWSNGVVDLDTSEAGENKVRNEVYLNAPAPAKVKVSLTFATFSDPFNVTMDLIPFTNPTGNGSLLLPFSTADLGHGEYVVTSAKHWANGGANGTQIFAHDIDVQARVNGDWSGLLSGTDGSKNNIIVSGESRYVVQKGSIPVALRQVGATVTAGQTLGLAGNSGRSDAPHLHLECRDFSTNTLRGLPFRRGWVLDRDLVGTDHTGPWVRLTSDGISKEKVAIWPGLFLPLPMPDLHSIDEKLYAQVFGGVGQDGGGFVIVNGKIIRVPPRGPKWALLQSVIALNAVEHVRNGSAERLRREVTETIRDITKDLGQGF